MSYDDFDIDKARELRARAKDSFIKQSRRSLIGTLVGSLPFIALVLFASAKWGRAGVSETGLLYALIMLVALIMTQGLWAAYGLDARLLLLLKEIKQLRLDLLSSQEAPPERATGGVESITTWAAEALKPKVFFPILLALCGLAGGIGLLADSMTNKHSELFGGQEVVEVHVTPEGQFRVVSRISITKCGDNVASTPLHLPQPGATLESVSIGGRSIPFAPVPDKKDTYTILPGMPENALKNTTLEVVWSPQAADVKINGNSRGFSLQLQGIIPVTAYTANAVIEDGAPYQFAYPGKASLKSLNLFWTKRPAWDYYGNPMGCCGVAIEATPNTQ